MLKIKKSDDVSRLLATIQSVGFKSAVIAGGFVRDAYFEHFYRDLDLYVWDPEYSHEDTGKFCRTNAPIHRWAELLNLQVLTDDIYFSTQDQIRKRFQHNPAYGMSRITAVFEIIHKLIPVEIIYTKIKPINHVNTYFDVGLCKAYFDGTKCCFTPDFMHDARNKCMTIVGKEMTHYEWSRTNNEHIPRLQAKFPGFRVEIAPHNEKFVVKKKSIL